MKALTTVGVRLQVMQRAMRQVEEQAMVHVMVRVMVREMQARRQGATQRDEMYPARLGSSAKEHQ